MACHMSGCHPAKLADFWKPGIIIHHYSVWTFLNKQSIYCQPCPKHLPLAYGDDNSSSFQGMWIFNSDLFMEIPIGLYFQWHFLDLARQSRLHNALTSAQVITLCSGFTEELDPTCRLFHMLIHWGALCCHLMVPIWTRNQLVDWLIYLTL